MTPTEDLNALSSNELTPTAPPVQALTGPQRVMRTLGWIFFGIFCLILFTLAKLPDDRIKVAVDQFISSQLSTQDVSYSSNEGKLSVLFGVSYTLKGVDLVFPAPLNKAHIDEIQFNPSLFPMLIGKWGGSFKLISGKGSLSGSVSLKGSQITFSFNSKQLDLSQVGASSVMATLANVRWTALLNGSGSISGDLSVPGSLEGNLQLTLKEIVIDSQSIMGFSVPRIGISEGVIDLNFEKAKAIIKSVRLGSSNSLTANATDEIQGTIKGELNLGKDWQSSQLNLKTYFSFSDSIMKSFVLLDAILGPGKQPDGSYAYALTGPITYPIPAPIPPGSAH